MLACLTTAAIQNAADAQRFLALGLPAQTLHITGNIKFDVTIEQAQAQAAQQLKDSLSDQQKRLVLIAASTHLGEDEIILAAYKQLQLRAQQSILLVLVPRHPERFDAVAQLCLDQDLLVVRRTSGAEATNQDVLLGDTMGELMLLYGASDIAFVGGSLVAKGGHNFIEPAAWGVPLVSGNSVFNFAQVAELMQQAGALQLVSTPTQLTDSLLQLVSDSSLRQQQGDAAKEVVNNNRGALAKTLRLIKHAV
jgi:3-deoxy-D-manno-octulosonic-acid transferase